MKAIAFVAMVILAAGARGGEQAGSSDLDAYIEGIRASRISEMGRNQLVSVAAICCGASILDYHKDEASGQYWASYTSAACLNPDADAPDVAKWKKLRLSETDVLADRLKPFADTDGSGFVTTMEASLFRDLVEFGYLVAQANRDEGTGAAIISRASGESPGDVAKKIKEYDALARRIHDAGIAELPKVALTAD